MLPLLIRTSFGLNNFKNKFYLSATIVFLVDGISFASNNCKGRPLRATSNNSPVAVFKGFISRTCSSSKNPLVVGNTAVNFPLPFPLKSKP